MHQNRVKPGPGQESVWDFPRPPRAEPTDRHIKILFNGAVIADTRRAARVLETSHPPVYYIPREDIVMQYLEEASGTSWCEFKGRAAYFDVVVDGKRADRAGWTYPDPAAGYESIRNHIAFYPQKMDACYVDDERVTPQPGGFYGGWITSDIVGPFKGGPGTMGW